MTPTASAATARGREPAAAIATVAPIAAAIRAPREEVMKAVRRTGGIAASARLRPTRAPVADSSQIRTGTAIAAIAPRAFQYPIG